MVLINAVFDIKSSIEETTNRLQEFAQKVRKEDLLSLENETITDPFMARAVRLAVDGVPVDTIRQTLEDEMKALKDRHESAQGIFQFMGDIAPAMGMIGTLIGLVQMLQNLDDPSSIGPAMAVAMLTTLYGSLIANLICIPITGKLKDRTKVENRNMRLVVEGIESIVKGENAMITKEKLEAFLAPFQREPQDGGGE
jgi:chemotaxis protein MotA